MEVGHQDVDDGKLEAVADKSRLSPSSTPVWAAVSRARTAVVPTATTRAASRQAAKVSAGTGSARGA